MPSRYGPPHFRRDGYVSIWATIAPSNEIPEDYCVPNYEDEEAPFSEFAGDFKFGSYDLDFSESFASDGPACSTRDLLKYLSYSRSFIDEAENAAKAKKLEATEWIFLLYDFDYDPNVTGVTESRYMRFLGSFQFDKKSGPAEQWKG